MNHIYNQKKVIFMTNKIIFTVFIIFSFYGIFYHGLCEITMIKDNFYLLYGVINNKWIY